MAWVLMEKVRAHRATLALAVKFRDMQPPNYDRPLSPLRMSVYRGMMKTGGFRPVTWACAFCVETGLWYRVNGKHTSTLIVELFEAGEEAELDAIVEKYKCDTFYDVAKLYATFDSKTMTRTSKDIYKQFGRSNPALVDCSDRIFCLAAPGMAYAKWPGDTYSHMSPVQRAELLCVSPGTEFCLWLQEILGASGKREFQPAKQALEKVGVIAAMFATWLKAKGDATQFWCLVRDESDPTPADPSRKLARYIISTGLVAYGHGEKTQGEGKGKAKVAGIEEFYAKSITAWNAWRRGESTNLLYFADKKPPSPV
jgi:hypothetical protein